MLFIYFLFFGDPFVDLKLGTYELLLSLHLISGKNFWVTEKVTKCPIEKKNTFAYIELYCLNTYTHCIV